MLSNLAHPPTAYSQTRRRPAGTSGAESPELPSATRNPASLWTSRGIPVYGPDTPRNRCAINAQQTTLSCIANDLAPQPTPYPHPCQHCVGTIWISNTPPRATMTQRGFPPASQPLGHPAHTLSTGLSTHIGDKPCEQPPVARCHGQHVRTADTSLQEAWRSRHQTACPKYADLAHFATALSRHASPYDDLR
jgi:hypothetical protein